MIYVRCTVTRSMFSYHKCSSVKKCALSVIAKYILTLELEVQFRFNVHMVMTVVM